MSAFEALIEGDGAKNKTKKIEKTVKELNTYTNFSSIYVYYYSKRNRRSARAYNGLQTKRLMTTTNTHITIMPNASCAGWPE